MVNNVNFLKREKAPITVRAWEEIDKRAVEIFSTQLYGRRLIEIEGPYGWKYSAHPIGETQILSDEGDRVKWGLRKSLPLIEIRVSFVLDIWELDNVERGKENIDLSSLEEAAAKVAEFEDKVIFYGCDKAGITGLLKFAEKRSIDSSLEEEKFVQSILKSIAKFSEDGIKGPFHLVINTEKWATLLSKSTGYPLNKRIEDLLNGGRVVPSPRLEDAVLISKADDNFKLILGQDLSIGYEDREGRKLKFFITESFTFNAVVPEAVIGLKFQ